jgi:hypothetical protein
MPMVCRNAACGATSGTTSSSASTALTCTQRCLPNGAKGCAASLKATAQGPCSSPSSSAPCPASARHSADCRQPAALPIRPATARGADGDAPGWTTRRPGAARTRAAPSRRHARRTPHAANSSPAVRSARCPGRRAARWPDRAVDRARRGRPAPAQLVAVAEEARGDRHALANLAQRRVAAIGEHGVGFAVQGGVGPRLRRPSTTRRPGSRPAADALGQQAREQRGEHRLGAGHLADVAGLHQQAAHQAPQRQPRHVAGPAVRQHAGPEGANGAALHRRLETIQHLGIGEVLATKRCSCGARKVCR